MFQTLKLFSCNLLLCLYSVSLLLRVKCTAYLKFFPTTVSFLDLSSYTFNTHLKEIQLNSHSVLHQGWQRTSSCIRRGMCNSMLSAIYPQKDYLQFVFFTFSLCLGLLKTLWQCMIQMSQPCKFFVRYFKLSFKPHELTIPPFHWF